MLRQRCRLERLDLWPIHAHQQQSSHECPKDLTKDIMGNLLPWKALPDGETERDGWVEMPAGGGGAGDDGEGDADGEGPANLKEGAKGGGAKGAAGVESEAGYGGDTGEAVGRVIRLLAVPMGRRRLTHRRTPQWLRPYILSAIAVYGLMSIYKRSRSERELPGMLEIKFPLRYRLRRNDMSMDMPLNSICCANLHYIR